MYLQKAKNAKRVYANLLYSKANCDGYKEEGITYPSGKMQMRLLKEFYEDINIPPSTVNFVEAHSTGTIVGDPEVNIFPNSISITPFNFKYFRNVVHLILYFVRVVIRHFLLALSNQIWVIRKVHREHVRLQKLF